MLKAKNIMTRNVLTLKPEDSLFSIVNKLSVGGISGAPVLEGKKVIGIVSESDIIDALDVHTKINFSTLPQFAFVVAALESKHHQEFKSEMRYAAKLRAENIMSRNPVSVGPEDTLEHVSRLMNKKDVNRVCVVDSHKRLLGIIARSDIVRALSRLNQD